MNSRYRLTILQNPNRNESPDQLPWLAFLRDCSNPAASVWMQFPSEESARAGGADLLAKAEGHEGVHWCQACGRPDPARLTSIASYPAELGGFDQPTEAWDDPRQTFYQAWICPDCLKRRVMHGAKAAPLRHLDGPARISTVPAPAAEV